VLLYNQEVNSVYGAELQDQKGFQGSGSGGRKGNTLRSWAGESQGRWRGACGRPALSTVTFVVCSGYHEEWDCGESKMRGADYELYLLARRALLNREKLSPEEIDAAESIVADAMRQVSPSMRALMVVENEILADVAKLSDRYDDMMRYALH